MKNITKIIWVFVLLVVWIGSLILVSEYDRNPTTVETAEAKYVYKWQNPELLDDYNQIETVTITEKLDNKELLDPANNMQARNR